MFNLNRPTVTALLVFCLGNLMTTTQAQACACCSESGSRSESESSISPFERATLSSLQPALQAIVKSNNGALGELDKEDPFGTIFALKVQKSDSEWIFELSNKEGLRGNLTFPLPKTAHQFMADPAPPIKNDERPRDAKLYKEWKFTSRSEGSGLFAQLNAGDRSSELIFRGTGNWCLDKANFHSWVLIVKNADSRLEIIGHLDSFNQ